MRKSADMAREFIKQAEAAGKGLSPEGYRPFPTELLPKSLRDIIVQGAAAIGVDEAFFAIPILAIGAAAIGSTRRIRLKHDWAEPSMIWAAVIAGSGCLKSPPLDRVIGPVQELQDDHWDDYNAEVKRFNAENLRYEAELQVWKRLGRKKGEPKPEEPRPPACRRVVVQDVTIEALAAVLQDNPRGVLLFRDELSAWLNSFDQYRRRGGGADAANWIELYHARTLTVDRKTGTPRTIRVRNAAVSITGTIQPETLTRVLTPEYFEMGLASRLLLCMPPRRKKCWTAAKISEDAGSAYSSVIRGLFELEHDRCPRGRSVPRLLPLAPDAQALWIDYYNAFAEVQYDTTNAHLVAALSKIEGAAARLALVVHLVRAIAGLASPDEIDIESIQAGIGLAKWFAYETGRVYRELRFVSNRTEHNTLVELIRSRGGEIAARGLMRVASAQYATANQAAAALEALLSAGYATCRFEQSPNGGRPTKVYTLVEPAQSDTTPHDAVENGGSVSVSSVST